MEQVLPLLLPQRVEIPRGQHELDGIEEIGLPRPVPTHNNVVLGAGGGQWEGGGGRGLRKRRGGGGG